MIACTGNCAHLRSWVKERGATTTSARSATRSPTRPLQTPVVFQNIRRTIIFISMAYQVPSSPLAIRALTERESKVESCCQVKPDVDHHPSPRLLSVVRSRTLHQIAFQTDKITPRQGHCPQGGSHQVRPPLPPLCLHHAACEIFWPPSGKEAFHPLPTDIIDLPYLPHCSHPIDDVKLGVKL